MFNIINNLLFKGIIDPHVHSGHWYHEGTPGHYYGKEFTDSLKHLTTWIGSLNVILLQVQAELTKW